MSDSFRISIFMPPSPALEENRTVLFLTYVHASLARGDKTGQPKETVSKCAIFPIALSSLNRPEGTMGSTCPQAPGAVPVTQELTAPTARPAVVVLVGLVGDRGHRSIPPRVNVVNVLNVFRLPAICALRVSSGLPLPRAL